MNHTVPKMNRDLFLMKGLRKIVKEFASENKYLFDKYYYLSFYVLINIFLLLNHSDSLMLQQILLEKDYLGQTNGIKYQVTEMRARQDY
jgi:hypothetical protein